MTYWVQYAATRVILLALLVGTSLFVVRYPAMWAPLDHASRWGDLPGEAFAVTRALLLVALGLGWACMWMASRSLRQQRRRP